jgi:uncharacterized membrane protein YkvA (DUF1232 family)
VAMAYMILPTICAMVYVASPYDAVSEEIYGAIGMIDDVGVVTACLYALSNAFFKYL